MLALAAAALGSCTEFTASGPIAIGGGVANGDLTVSVNSNGYTSAHKVVSFKLCFSAWYNESLAAVRFQMFKIGGGVASAKWLLSYAGGTATNLTDACFSSSSSTPFPTDAASEPFTGTWQSTVPWDLWQTSDAGEPGGGQRHY